VPCTKCGKTAFENGIAVSRSGRNWSNGRAGHERAQLVMAAIDDIGQPRLVFQGTSPMRPASRGAAVGAHGMRGHARAWPPRGGITRTKRKSSGPMCARPDQKEAQLCRTLGVIGRRCAFPSKTDRPEWHRRSTKEDRSDSNRRRSKRAAKPIARPAVCNAHSARRSGSWRSDRTPSQHALGTEPGRLILWGVAAQSPSRWRRTDSGGLSVALPLKIMLGQGATIGRARKAMLELDHRGLRTLCSALKKKRGGPA